MIEVNQRDLPVTMLKNWQCQIADLLEIIEIDRDRLTLSIFTDANIFAPAFELVSVSLSHKSVFYRNVRTNGQMLRGLTD